MAKSSRRDFITGGSLVAGAIAVGSCRTTGKPTSEGGGHPELAVINARVYTVDQQLPRAEALAVKNGRFLAVGTTDDIQNLIGPDTQVINADGMTVTLGFIDVHCHPSGVRKITGVNVNLLSISEIQEDLQKKAADTSPGYWVEGYMYADTKLQEGRSVTRTDLEQAVPDHPAMVGHRGGLTRQTRRDKAYSSASFVFPVHAQGFKSYRAVL